MADPVVERLKEDKLRTLSIQKKRIRGVLIVVNAILLSYFSFLFISSIVDYVKTNLSTGEGDTITVLGKSENTSLNIYKLFIGYDKENGWDTCEINDFAIYGHYLLTSNTRVTANSTFYENKLHVVKLNTKGDLYSAISETSVGSPLNKGIDLFKLEEGDYFLANMNFDPLKNKDKYTAYHYNGKELLSETIYSLPNEDGVRKMITVSGKDSSPAIVISVKNTSSFPKDYYDFVVIGEENKIPELSQNNRKVKYCTSNDSLVEAYLTPSCYAIDVSNTSTSSFVVSSYLDDVEGATKSTKLSSGAYDGLDTINSIRELGGYVFNAGFGAYYDDNYSITEASVKIMNNKLNNHKGKLAISISQDTAFDAYRAIFSL